MKTFGKARRPMELARLKLVNPGFLLTTVKKRHHAGLRVE
jgi:hypothetical protein